MRRLILSVALLASAGACGAREDAVDSFSVTDSAGIRIAHNTAQTWTAGEEWEVPSDPAVSIGVLEGADEYQFFYVSAGARQSGGEILVVNSGTREIRRYSPDGEFLNRIGGPGDGPGEFQYPGQVLVGPGDTILVWDNPVFRISRYDPAGHFVDATSLDRGEIAAGIEPPFFTERAELLPDGRILIHLFESGGAESYPEGLFRPRGGVMMTTAELTEMDTLMFYGGIEQMFVETSQRPMPIVPPGAKRSWTAYQGRPSRVCIGDQETTEVVCFGADGTETRVRWESEPVPITSAEVDAWAEQRIEAYAERIPEEDARRAIDQADIPEYWPPYGAVRLDLEGNLWVAEPSGRENTTIRHRVFDPEGRLLGQVTTPAVQILEIGSDYILAVQRDESDVEYVQVYSLVK